MQLKDPGWGTACDSRAAKSLDAPTLQELECFLCLDEVSPHCFSWLGLL